ncbi:NUDIX hydrolase [Agarilytica rhodophyticola]|uniref:NUDIX hydrolase n=1 Tax=Agarilytica rhodophyticola TaxID=1737490 RepID=UPI000B347DB5|nr:NUDIX hydrolase [Agarilytica rhodophyticola]
MSDIKQLGSKVVYENKWMTVREDRIVRQSGAEGIFGVVDKPDFVVIAPIEGDYIHLVEQYRYPVGQRFMELPQGSWEENPEVDHLQVAMGELREETGLIAQDLIYVGHQYLAYGYSNQGYHIYLAKNLQQHERQCDLEEEDLITKKVTLDSFEEMIRSGIIKDATTITAYSFIKLKGLL